MDEAQGQFRRAVKLAPDRPESLYHLALLAKVRRDDGTVDALETALRHAASLQPSEQCLLYFALAKAYDDIGERDRGFDHLLRGNAVKRARIGYEEAGTLGAMNRITRVFTAEFLAARKDLGDPSRVPVFIVGMPRSGTTLVEQTLASHTAVYGAGERTELSQSVGRMCAERLGAAAYPEATWTMSGEQFRQMGSEYVAALRALARGAARITDKMPGNFLFVGLIRMILPNAENHSCSARAGGYLPVLFFQAVHGRAVVQLRSRGTRPVSSCVSAPDGALASGFAGGRSAGGELRGSGGEL